MGDAYQIVQLANGAYSVRSLALGETFHPVIGPVAEAEALYVRQLRLLERMAASPGEFVVWDVGLGAAANPLTLIQAAAHLPKRLRMISFDLTPEPLAFALEHWPKLDYLGPYRLEMEQLSKTGEVNFCSPGGLQVSWQSLWGDFPTLLAGDRLAELAKPHAIFYDAFSPQRNSAMWTLPVFSRLHKLLDPARPCAMPTYSRSTMLRVTLLVAGFFVGIGHATGEKEETTIAANTLELIEEPLHGQWLARARRSRSAEPLELPEYRQAALRNKTLERLLEHPQFR